MERPQVIVTYAEDRKFYPHPDHIRVHEISRARVRRGGGSRGSSRRPGPPWQPSKMYYTGFSRRRVVALHEAYLARGEESPYTSWFERGLPERCGQLHDASSTSATTCTAARAALLAHRTQVDPEGFWMRIPDDVIREVFPWEEFLLARSLVDTGFGEGEVEDDLFAGLRAG